MKFWEREGTRGDIHQGRFQSGGVSLAFAVQGEGPPVILVHGFASSLATNWRTPGIMDAIAKAGFQAAAFDCRGHGDSDRPAASGAYDRAAMAADVARFIDHLGGAAPVLVGYSMGARLVLHLLATQPGIARSAIIGGVGDNIVQPVESFSAQIADALLTAEPGAIKDPIARRFRLFAERQGNDLRALAQCITEVMQPIDRESISRIDVPVFVVVGSDDDQISEPDRLAGRLPRGRLEVIAGRNHMTIIGDARFRKAIVDFVKGSP